MTNDMELIEKEISDRAIRASADGMNMAVALTADQLVIGQGGLPGQAGEVRRYPLSSLTGIRFLRNEHGDLLALEFSARSSRVVLFVEDARRKAEQLVNLLECPVKKIFQF